MFGNMPGTSLTLQQISYDVVKATVMWNDMSAKGTDVPSHSLVTWRTTSVIVNNLSPPFTVSETEISLDNQ